MQDIASIERERLRACARRLAAGVAVVTTCDAAGRPFGLTMSAVTCLSFEPALFVICVGEASDTLPALLQRGAFAINILRREQEAVARVFAGKAGARKFDGVEHAYGTLPNLPVLADALAVVECEVVAAHPGGDHRIVIGSVRAARAGEGEPLLYYASAYRGIEPADAVPGFLPSDRSLRPALLGAA
jgi:flavin reductase (DIM6/NTAB) family NADH-FMN oxidoreductase RutF